MMAALPNLIVIGSPKCGTSSLHYYLSLHPEIFMSREKELNFFIEEKSFGRGVAWYQAQFETDRPVKIIGEASPGYTHYPVFRGVPQRMHSIVPNARLIQIVRDPMKRLVSHYFHELEIDDGNVDADINKEAGRLGDSYIVSPSLQCLQLELYLQYYPQGQILLLAQEDLARDRSETMRRVFRFLGVDDSFESAEFSQMLNVRKSSAPSSTGIGLLKAIQSAGFGSILPPRIKDPIRKALLRPFSQPIKPPLLERELEQRLLNIFHEDAERLRRLTGMKFEEWCV
jgi:hypothetical protein